VVAGVTNMPDPMQEPTTINVNPLVLRTFWSDDISYM
jgi:hypothetical protein